MIGCGFVRGKERKSGSRPETPRRLSIHRSGKGTGHGGHTHVIPSDDKSDLHRYNYGMIDTYNGGGLYDIKGRNEIGGREYLQTINKYNEDHKYGEGSVDTSLNIKDGQYFVKI